MNAVCLQGENAVCVFSGQPYSDLRPEEAELRNKSLQREQDTVERLASDVKSPRYQARGLPISKSRWVYTCIYSVCGTRTLFGQTKVC